MLTSMRVFKHPGVVLLTGLMACGGEARRSHGERGSAAGAPGGVGSGRAGSMSGAPALGTAGASHDAGGGIGGGARAGSAGSQATAGVGAGALGGGGGADTAAEAGGMTTSGHGGADADGGTGGTGAIAGHMATPIPLEQVSETLARAYCALDQRCAQGLETNGFVMPGEDCVLLTQQRLELNGLEKLAAAVSAGHVAYHPELMQACADAITAPECADTINRELPSCEAALTGKRALGEPCEFNEECAGSLLCETRYACPGECVERYSVGVRCTVDAECADGLGCDVYTGECQKAVGVGEACEGDINTVCLPGLFCEKEVSDALNLHRPPGTCAYISHGPRQGDPPCDVLQGILCSNEDLNPSNHCVLASLVDDEATWSCEQSSTECGLAFPEQCPDGQYCPVDLTAIDNGTFTKTCAPLPKAGEKCARRPLLPTLLPECAPYARCDSGGNCNELGAVGALCDDDEQCVTGFCDGFQCARSHACP